MGLKDAVNNAKELREKRDSYDLALPVDAQPFTPAVSYEIIDAGADKDKKNPKALEVNVDGASAELNLSGGKLRLDAEGIRNAARVFNEIAAGL